MDVFKAWLVSEDQNSSRRSVIWNALGGGLLTGQAAIVLMFVARTDTLQTAGVVTLAYALATLVLSFARFGMRNFEVTDVHEQYSFSDYKASRWLTVSFAALVTACALGVLVGVGAYDSRKAAVVAAIVVLKLVDAVEDLYVGRHQQIDRFLSGTKICALHQLLVTASICVAVVCTRNTLLSFCIGDVASVATLALLVGATAKVRVPFPAGLSSRVRVRKLLVQCLPLCVGMVLASYVGNIPKYAIDLYLDSASQAVFGYLMLPVFAVTLLNQFIYQPFVRNLASLWDVHDLRGLARTIGRQCLIVLGIALAVLALFLGVGLPMLSLMYNVDLSPFRVEFAGLMVGGVLYSLASYLSVPITVMRDQGVVGAGYAIASLGGLLMQGILVPLWGFGGVIVLYALCNIILLAVFAGVLLFRLGVEGKGKEGAARD